MASLRLFVDLCTTPMSTPAKRREPSGTVREVHRRRMPMFLDYPSLRLGLRCLNRNCFRCCRVGAGSNGEGGILDHLTQHDPLPPPRITKHADGGSTPILCR